MNSPGDDAPRFDFVFTVCEGAALLPRSVWQGKPIFAHWGVPNPAFVEGNEAQIRLAYADAFRMLSSRIGIFVNLPLHSLDRLTMQHDLKSIGNGDAVEQQTVAIA